jgi:hypothetical protein
LRLRRQQKLLSPAGIDRLAIRLRLAADPDVAAICREDRGEVNGGNEARLGIP